MKIKDKVKYKLNRFFHIVFWRLLKKSLIFRIWYKEFLNSLLFDLELCDIESERDLVFYKYKNKLEFAKTYK